MEMHKEYYYMAGMEAAAGSSAVTTEAPMAMSTTTSEDDGELLRRGPWTAQEDALLLDYISTHGEGRWNSLARCAGLGRTGKSCRLRWLNYLRPDVRRGDITPEEQLLILELHSRWGNRWSKIARCLPAGRTDNEVKNYWRTRVQKHARQLRCDVNSDRFRDVVRHVWMPRLVERMQADAAAAPGAAPDVPMSSPDVDHASGCAPMIRTVSQAAAAASAMSPDTWSTPRSSLSTVEASQGAHFSPWGAATADVDGTLVQCAGSGGPVMGGCDHLIHGDELSGSWSDLLAATGLPDFEFGDFDDNLWSLEDVYSQQQQQQQQHRLK